MATLPRPSFSLLPNELVREVILAGIPPQPYDDEKDNFPAARYRARWLSRLARVSKEWNDICIPLLYHEVIFELSREGEKARLSLFYSQLDHDPSLGQLVHRFYWTQDAYQLAMERTALFLARSHLFPSLQSVSVLSILSRTSQIPNSPPPPPASSLFKPPPILPNLKSLRLVSWDVESDRFIIPSQQPNEWYHQHCLLTSNAFGNLTNLEEIQLSFQDIEFPLWLLTQLHQRANLSTPSHVFNLKHLHLFGPFFTPDQALHPQLLSLLTLVGPTLQTLHLNNEDDLQFSINSPNIPSLSESLTLCPQLKWLSIDLAFADLALTLSGAGGHPNLVRLWAGHSASHQRRENGFQDVEEEVGLLVNASFEESEGGGRRFPKLKEVGFWDLDFRETTDGKMGDLESEGVRKVGRTLKEKGLRLVDRFGSCWRE